MSTISLRKAGKQYGATEIIGDLNLEIADGEFVVIVGPSGCHRQSCANSSRPAIMRSSILRVLY
jgi:ABC-type nitrate/sulfonate/bicarbonate transport system ATPase subunit